MLRTLFRTSFFATLTAMCAAFPAGALTLLETAEYSPPGHAGYAIDSQFLGARFEIDTQSRITAIGGHINPISGTLFGAVVRLTGPDALPSVLPDALATHDQTLLYQTFDQPQLRSATSDLLMEVSITLGPGQYALIFGGAATGGEGRMEIQKTELGAPSFFFGGSGFWQDGGFSHARFLVEGVSLQGANARVATTPLPGGALLLPAAIGGLWLFRRRRATA